MKETQIDDFNTLVTELNCLCSRGYIFRGQSSSSFCLQPQAFRMDGLINLKKKFSTDSIVSLHDCYLSLIHPKSTNSDDEEISHYLKNFPSFIVERIHNLTVYTMMYHYSLSEYYFDNKKEFDDETRKIYETNCDWKSKYEYKKGLLEFFRNAAEYSSVKTSTIIKKGTVHDTTSGNFDITLPQHYGVPTAALDWTECPLTALFFATYNIPSWAERFSVYAYKEWIPILKEEKPISLKQGTNGIENPRLKKQKGLFSILYNPCEFYFLSGRWPMFGEWSKCNKNYSEILLKYSSPVSNSSRIIEMLAKEGITEGSLF